MSELSEGRELLRFDPDKEYGSGFKLLMLKDLVSEDEEVTEDYLRTLLRSASMSFPGLTPIAVFKNTSTEERVAPFGEALIMPNTVVAMYSPGIYDNFDKLEEISKSDNNVEPETGLEVVWAGYVGEIDR